MPGFKSISIIGCGNMGGALLRGVAKSKKWQLSDIKAFDADENTLKNIVTETGVQAVSKPSDLLSSEALVLAVKPQIFSHVAEELKGTCPVHFTVVSIMAGLKTSAINTALGVSNATVRTMPNLPLNIFEGATAIATDNHADAIIQSVDEIFQSVGRTAFVTESLMDAVTGLSGSGPMYVFEFVSGLISGGVQSGLAPETAKILAIQTVKGALQLLQGSTESPEFWSKKVCSPGGTTLAALDVLNKNDFKPLISKAIQAAVARSIELGKVSGLKPEH